MGLDNLRNNINKVVETTKAVVKGQLTKAEIGKWIDELVTAIANGEEGKKNDLWNLLKPLMADDQLLKVLVQKGVLRGDHATLEKVILFALHEKHLPNTMILESVWNDVGGDARTTIVKTLAEAAGNFDDLLNAIGTFDYNTAKTMVKTLADIEVSDRDKHWRKMLRSSAMSAMNGPDTLFNIVVDVLYARVGDNSGKLISLALGIDDTEPRRNTVSRLLRYLQEKGWFVLNAVVQFIYEQAGWLFYRLVEALLDFLGGWNCVADLLNVAPAVYPSDQNKMANLFHKILDALVGLAERRGVLTTLAKEVATWLRQEISSAEESVRDGEMPGDVKDVEETHIPLPAWLVARALEAMAGSVAPSLAGPCGIVSQFAQALVNALREMGEAGDAVMAVLMRAPGAFLILVPFLVLVAAAIPMQFITWVGKNIKELGDPLPPPGGQDSRKYMIFSDIHRDANGDVVNPQLFDCANFSKNREMYKQALEYCTQKGYTVIENGDCEELWFRPHVIDKQEDRATAIVRDHQAIYDLLRTLYEKGRYFRTRGNHDNWWVLGYSPNKRRNALNNAFGTGATDFPIYNALVIPEVKTMEEDYRQLVIDFTNAGSDEERLQVLINSVPLGLSPDRYTEKLPLFIFHGHQIDFWNCDEHQFLGHIIANAVGVPADGIDAFPYYLKGIDLAGNPVYKFTDMLVGHTPWGSWPPKDVARRWARHIEFMPETDRKLVDDYMFSETLAAALSLVLYYDPDRDHSSFYCQNLGPKVQILTGHTHNVQSRPYLNLTFLPDVPSKPDPKPLMKYMKVPYYNSGTCGWWEGILWAIEITDQGQPRIVYWDCQNCEPHQMSWELHDDKPIVNPNDVQRFLEEIRRRLPAGGGQLPAPVQDILNNFRRFAAPFVEDVREVTLAGLEVAQQYATIAGILLQIVRAIVCHEQMPQRVQLTIDLPTVPTRENTHVELAAFAKPPQNMSLTQFFTSWVNFYHLIPNPQAPVSDANLPTLAALCFHAALLFRSGLLNIVGHLVMLCAHEAFPGDVDIRFNQDQSTITFVLSRAN